VKQKVGIRTVSVVLIASSTLCVGLISGCWLSQPKRPSTATTLASYRDSEFNNWFPLPDDAQDVFVHFFPGFDTNYRAISFRTASPNIQKLIENAIKTNVQHSGENVTWIQNFRFSLDGLFSTFIYGEDAIPGWWVTGVAGSTSKTLNAYIAFWSHDGYGLGYLVLHQPIMNEVWVLQFSQQHLTIERVQQSFQADVAAAQ
jgi:hypothetical protein